MKDSIFSLLLLLGIGQAKVDELKAKYDDAAFKPDISALVDEARGHQKTLLENDKEFVDAIRGKEKGRQRDIFEAQMKKKFGLTPEEMKDKSTEEIVALAHTKATTTGNKTLDDITLELTNVKAENKRLLEEEIPKVRSEVDGHKQMFELNQSITKKFSAYGEKLRVPAEAAQTATLSALSGKYDMSLNEKGEIEFRDKGTKMLAKSKDGTKILTADDVFEGQMKEFQFLKESNVDDNKDKKKPVVTVEKDENAGKQTRGYQGLSKAEQHLESIKTPPTP